MVYPRDTIKELISTPFSQERFSTEMGHVGETSRILVKMLSARQLSPTESNKCLRPTFPALYGNRLRYVYRNSQELVYIHHENQ